MFENYSQIYAAQILTIAGLAEIIGNSFGWSFTTNDYLFVLGLTANMVGIVWTLVNRYKQGGVTLIGTRLAGAAKVS